MLRAYWVHAIPPCRCSHHPKGNENSTSGLSHNRPISCNQHKMFLSQASAHLQGVTDATPSLQTLSDSLRSQATTKNRDDIPTTSSGGSFPFSVFPLTNSDIIPMNPNPSVRLRSQVFATSQRLIPFVNCRAYSIPVPLLGFPFEALIHPQCRTSFRNAESLRVEPKLLFQGLNHIVGSPPTGPRFRRMAVLVPPWVSPFEVSCRMCGSPRATTRMSMPMPEPIPSRACSLSPSRWPQRVHPRVLNTFNAAYLSRDRRTSMGFMTS
jgi:hypothetical protein